MRRVLSAIEIFERDLIRPFAIILTQDLAHIYREAAAGDQTHAACHRATMGRVVLCGQ